MIINAFRYATSRSHTLLMPGVLQKTTPSLIVVPAGGGSVKVCFRLFLDYIIRVIEIDKTHETQLVHAILGYRNFISVFFQTQQL